MFQKTILSNLLPEILYDLSVSMVVVSEGSDSRLKHYTGPSRIVTFRTTEVPGVFSSHPKREGRWKMFRI